MKEDSAVLEEKPRGSYWAGEGKYSQEIESVFEPLVPNRGKADDPFVEAVRCVSNIVYEVYNNGGGNFFSRISYLDEYLAGIACAVGWETCMEIRKLFEGGDCEVVPPDWETNPTIFDDLVDKVLEWALAGHTPQQRESKTK